MAQYDLTSELAQHLDRHLVFPLLEFLGSKGLYDEKDIEAAKLALIEKTNMVDYAVDIYQQLNQTDEVGRMDWQGGCSAQRAATAFCRGAASSVFCKRACWAGGSNSSVPAASNAAMAVSTLPNCHTRGCMRHAPQEL
jgi:hypothetical protein